MLTAALNALQIDKITIFTAKRIITMDESRPDATAVAVSQGRIVEVGSLEDMQPWFAGREVQIDRRFDEYVLMPGLIDNHLHPFVGAMLMPMAHIAPEAWRQVDGSMSVAARTPEIYHEQLLKATASKLNKSEWFISWGYQPSLHGKYTRARLDALFPDRPIVLWHRSFHELFLNTAAIQKLALNEAECQAHPQIDWLAGHFYETGCKNIIMGLLPHFMGTDWYNQGLRDTAKLMHMGGITTAGDMLFGALSPEYEVQALKRVLEVEARPMRVVNVFDARGFSNRATATEVGPPDQFINFEAGLAAIEAWKVKQLPDTTHGGNDKDVRVGKIWYAKAIKLFADGAMFSQLMQMRWPGYTDGHHGEWLMAPKVLNAGVQTFWKAGYTIHVHVNGDAGMDSVISALAEAQAKVPRFDHRFHAHHVAFHAQFQTEQLAALGAHASVNPYYIHALGDDYSVLGLGRERGSQITRSASMRNAGMRVSFHSDFMMAPPEPLTLAWCAATRQTLGGEVIGLQERLDLMQVLRGITIDAAWCLRIEDEVGSIAAGKRADFAVLADDPLQLGADRLNEVRVAGTVFEGQVFMLDQPCSSSLSPSLQAQTVFSSDKKPKLANRPIYKPVGDNCMAADRCDLLRQWADWFSKINYSPVFSQKPSVGF